MSVGHKVTKWLSKKMSLRLQGQAGWGLRITSSSSLDPDPVGFVKSPKP